jgi:hypothetical protein
MMSAATQSSVPPSGTPAPSDAIHSCAKLHSQCEADAASGPSGPFTNVFNKESCVFMFTCYAAYHVAVDDVLASLGPKDSGARAASEPRLSTNVRPRPPACQQVFRAETRLRRSSPITRRMARRGRSRTTSTRSTASWASWAGHIRPGALARVLLGPQPPAHAYTQRGYCHRVLGTDLRVDGLLQLAHNPVREPCGLAPVLVDRRRPRLFLLT